MNIGKACAIFAQINSDKYAPTEKAEAIRDVWEMPTHNGVTKDGMLAVIRYLLAEYDRLNDFEQTQCAKLLEKLGEAQAEIDRWKQNAFLAQQETGSIVEDLEEIRAQLAASQRRERATLDGELTDTRNGRRSLRVLRP